MADSLLQRQLDEMRDLLQRTRDLFGTNPIAPQPFHNLDTHSERSAD